MNATPLLRPMTIGDMFDAAFRLYREHFLTFIGIVALLQVPMAIVQSLAQLPYAQALQRFTTRPPIARPEQSILDLFPFAELLPYYALIIGLSVVQYLVVYNLIAGALANAIARSYLGKPVSILEAYSFGARRYLSLIGASLAPFAISVAFALIGGGCAIAALSTLGVRPGERANIPLAIGAILGLLVLIVLLVLAGLFIYIRLLLATQTIVLEGHGPLAGLTRSWRLVGQSFWRVLGIVLLMYIFAYIISLIVQLPVLGVLLASGIMLTNFSLYQIINVAVAHIVLILVLPFQFAMFTLLYYDLRVRKEGYDIEMMAQQAAQS